MSPWINPLYNQYLLLIIYLFALFSFLFAEIYAKRRVERSVKQLKMQQQFIENPNSAIPADHT